MIALIDTNIILDFILRREPFYEKSVLVMKHCAEGKITGYVAFHSLPNVWYVLRKYCSKEKRILALKSICNFLRIIGANHESVLKVITEGRFSDFEDSLQDCCATEIKADYIITRNIQDFKNSVTPAILPDEALKKL